MIEVQKSKSGNNKQESYLKSFRQEIYPIPKKKAEQNRYRLRNEALRRGSVSNPLLTRDIQSIKYKRVLDLPR